MLSNTVLAGETIQFVVKLASEEKRRVGLKLDKKLTCKLSCMCDGLPSMTTVNLC